MQTPFQRIPFGLAPVGSVITFQIHPGAGFEATAMLVRSTTPVASWESTELIAVPQPPPASEPLVVPGFYSLQVTIPFTSTVPSNCTIDVGLAIPGGGGGLQTITFQGVVNDVARLVADVVVR